MPCQPWLSLRCSCDIKEPPQRRLNVYNATKTLKDNCLRVFFVWAGRPLKTAHSVLTKLCTLELVTACRQRFAQWCRMKLSCNGTHSLACSLFLLPSLQLSLSPTRYPARSSRYDMVRSRSCLHPSPLQVRSTHAMYQLDFQGGFGKEGLAKTRNLTDSWSLSIFFSVCSLP